MTAIIRYLSHTNVLIRQDRPAGEWGLSPEGATRARRMATAEWTSDTVHVITSAERKAIETAEPFAAKLGLTPEIRPKMHENDRSATGYLPPPEFEETADAFFANPDQSVCGWETARQAQNRIVSETNAALANRLDGDILIVGHGAVGTLLMCHLAGIAISREHDQPPTNGGNYFSFQRDDRKLLHRWKPADPRVDLSEG